MKQGGRGLKRLQVVIDVEEEWQLFVKVRMACGCGIEHNGIYEFAAHPDSYTLQMLEKF